MIDINYYNLDDHQLTVALTVMDENWFVVMRSTDTRLVSQYVYERSRCQEEILHRASVERSFEAYNKARTAVMSESMIRTSKRYDLKKARYEDVE
jgi:hypothetical protein